MSDPTVQPGTISAAVGRGGPRRTAPSSTRPASSTDDLDASGGQGSTPPAVAGTSKSLRGKLVAWLQKPLAEKLWHVPAFLLLGLSRLALIIIPFSWIAPLLGRDMKANAIASVATAREVSRALAIGRAIGTAARHTPWESKCLTQALTARVLLGLSGLPYVLHLGVRLEADSSLTAHAWVSTGPGCVIGGPGFAEYKVLGTFVSRRVR